MIPKSERALIAACGMYCGDCGDYLAYVGNDEGLRSKVAAEIREQLNIDLTPEQVGCLGCWGEIHTPWAASLGCEVRRCAEGKGVLSCALCDGFRCERLDHQSSRGSKARTNLCRIKEVGLEVWLNEFRSRLDERRS